MELCGRFPIMLEAGLARIVSQAVSRRCDTAHPVCGVTAPGYGLQQRVEYHIHKNEGNAAYHSQEVPTDPAESKN